MANKAEWKLGKEEISQFELREMYRSYGYIPYRMGKFEEYELYMRNRNFLRSDRILTFTDTDGHLRAMKPDVTLSIVKNYTGGYQQKVCYNESVFRPGDSGFRQIQQIGLECIGNVDAYLQSEVLMLACRSLRMISETYLLDLSHLGFVAPFVDALFKQEKRKEVMRAIGQKNAARLRTLCGEAGLTGDRMANILELAAAYGSAEEMLGKMRGMIVSPQMLEACDELEETVNLVRVFEPDGKIMIDLSMIDDLHYYNGVIFRGIIEGIPETILSGGRYDNLLSRMGKEGQAIGFAVYLDLLERFEKEEERYDADVLLICDGEDTQTVIRAVEQLRKEDYTVRVQQDAGNLRFRKTARLKEGACIFDA